MQVATIRRALKEAGSFEAAVAAGLQEIEHRDALVRSGYSVSAANRQISCALAGFAASEFWAEDSGDHALWVAGQLWDSLRERAVVEEWQRKYGERGRVASGEEPADEYR